MSASVMNSVMSEHANLEELMSRDMYGWPENQYKPTLSARGGISARHLTVVFGRVCFYCGHELTSLIFSFDHVIPLSKGGRERFGNLVPACKTCNVRKADRLPTPEEADRIERMIREHGEPAT